MESDEKSWLELHGEATANLLKEWLKRAVPAEHVRTAWANRPPDADWHEFVDGLAGRLDSQLTEISRMRAIEDVDERIAGWDDDLFIAHISRMNQRVEFLRRELPRDAVLAVPDHLSLLSLAGVAIREFLVHPRLWPESGSPPTLFPVVVDDPMS